MPVPSNGLMERLKSETKSLHDSAENQALQKALVAGRLGRDLYIRYLGQMLIVHQALEPRIQALIESRPELKQAIGEHTFREGDLISDLAALGAREGEVPPEEPTRELVSDMERLACERPIALVGMHYVLEGANNGNRYIARSMGKALDLPDHRGVSYLDPYGEAQPARWREYKHAMSAMTIGPKEANAIIEAAKRMFEAIGRISREIAGTADETSSTRVVAATVKKTNDG